MCVCGAYSEVFCLHPSPSLTRELLLPVSETKVQEILQSDLTVRESVLIFAIPAIHATLVVLASVGVPTRLSRMKMTPAIHGFSVIPTLPLKCLSLVDFGI